jgi:hypothetical protein
MHRSTFQAVSVAAVLSGALWLYRQGNGTWNGSGTVLDDSTGQLISEVQLTYRNEDDRRQLPVGRGGRFVLDRASPTGVMTARSAGYALYRRTVRDVASAGGILRMRKAAKLLGTMSTPSFALPDGGHVIVMSCDERNSHVDLVPVSGTGTFSAPQLMPGNLRLLAGNGNLVARADLAIRPGQTQTIDLKAAPGGTILGMVEGKDDQPVRGASIEVAYAELDAGASTLHHSLGRPLVSDESGRFALLGVVPGVPLEVTAHIYGQQGRVGVPSLRSGERVRVKVRVSSSTDQQR